MEILFIFILSFLLGLISYILFPKKITNTELTVIITVPVILAGVIRLIMLSSNVIDVEYRGSHVVSSTYYEHWNEWIQRTCYETYPCGSDGKGHTRFCTRAYDCSYCQDHPAKWITTDNLGVKRTITKKDYDSLKSLWRSPETFLEMNRHYHTIDGDAYVIRWDSVPNHCIVHTTSHYYKNPIQASDNSIYKPKPLTKLERGQVYDYKPIVNDNQDAIYNLDSMNHQSINFINGYYGSKYQIRVHVLYFDSESMDVADLQIRHWQGGNMNELIIMIGKNWCKVHSWQDDKTLDAMIECFVINGCTLNELSDFLLEHIPTHWKRKSFRDFSYLKPILSPGQKLSIVLSMLITLLLIIIIATLNNHDRN